MPRSPQSPKPEFGGRSKPSGPLARCRLDLGCDRTSDGLALRRIRQGGAVAPTLCCEACATAAGDPDDVLGQAS